MMVVTGDDGGDGGGGCGGQIHVWYLWHLAPTRFLISGSCVEFLEVWLSLAEKLVNASAMLESSHSLPVPPPLQPGGKKPLFNPLFNPLAFVIKCQKVRRLCYNVVLSKD